MAWLKLVFISSTFVLAHGCAEERNSAPSGELSSAATTSPDEEINLDVWLERLEVGSRELYSARESVVAAVGLKGGDWIGDVGAGTGLYSLLFADAVGERGQVFAEDIEPLFLDLITRRVADSGVNNITAVLGRNDNIMLPANSMDVIFIADTYHYFDDREAIMRTIYDALKPSGRLVLVEYEITPGAERPDYTSHVRFGKTSVISEIEFIGFRLLESPKVDGLTENYLVIFEKPGDLQATEITD